MYTLIHLSISSFCHVLSCPIHPSESESSLGYNQLIGSFISCFPRRHMGRARRAPHISFCKTRVSVCNPSVSRLQPCQSIFNVNSLSLWQITLELDEQVVQEKLMIKRHEMIFLQLHQCLLRILVAFRSHSMQLRSVQFNVVTQLARNPRYFFVV